MTPPLCPKGHGPMILMRVTLGDDEIDLGCFWGCANDDEGKPDYCDEAEDYIPEPQQLEMEL
jgi:hypothetical protein